MVNARPAIILDGKKVRTLVNMNEKALSKTTETSVVWTVLENERVLPLEPEVKVKNIRVTDHWIEIDTLSSDDPRAEGVFSVDEKITSDEGDFFRHLTGIIRERHQTLPEGSYTTHLFSKGIDKIRKKTGEEAIELVLARDKNEIVSEAADLVYHMMVLLEAEGLTIADVISELKRREG